MRATALLFAGALLLAARPASAQEGPTLFPQLSPAAEVKQTIGVTTVALRYHRPAVKGREIWGKLVPFEQVWRMGANEATTISFSDPVKVEGTDVAAGTYAIFAIPHAESWTLILSRNARQFGAWAYNPKDDLLRFEVKPKPVSFNEWLTYEIYPASGSTAYVDLYWERLRVSFLVETDSERLTMERMRKALAKGGGWKLYADAAAYCADQEVQRSQGMDWAEKSIRIQENPTNLFVKARLLRQLGRADAAKATLEKAMKLAQARHDGPTIIGPMQQILDSWAKQN